MNPIGNKKGQSRERESSTSAQQPEQIRTSTASGGIKKSKTLAYKSATRAPVQKRNSESEIHRPQPQQMQAPQSKHHIAMIQEILDRNPTKRQNVQFLKKLLDQ